MFISSSVGAGFHVSAVVLAIVALSPAPLALPSGIAVAVIGLMGAVAVLTSPAAARWQPSLIVAPLRTNADDVTVPGSPGSRPRDGVRSTRMPAMTQSAADLGLARRVLTAAYPTYAVDVSRPVTVWRWGSILLAPIELLALAWSVPVLILLLIVPVGLALAGAVWLGRLLVSL